MDNFLSDEQILKSLKDAGNINSYVINKNGSISLEFIDGTHITFYPIAGGWDGEDTTISLEYDLPT